MYYRFEKRSIPFRAYAGGQVLSAVPHIHPHLELLYLTGGKCHATADNKTELLEEGALYLSFSNQIHYYDPVPIEGVMFIVDPALFPELVDIFYSKIPTSPIVQKEDLPEDIYDRLLRVCSGVESSDRLQQIAANGYAQSILAELLQKMELLDRTNDHDSLREVSLYCLENYKKPLTLDMLAKELHLSKYYISHMFAERLNISFPEFINGLRVESACRRLDNGRSITDAAFESGFNSIRSFNRNFERVMGISPREYMKKRQTTGSPEG